MSSSNDMRKLIEAIEEADQFNPQGSWGKVQADAQREVRGYWSTRLESLLVWMDKDEELWQPEDGSAEWVRSDTLLKVDNHIQAAIAVLRQAGK